MRLLYGRVLARGSGPPGWFPRGCISRVSPPRRTDSHLHHHQNASPSLRNCNSIPSSFHSGSTTSLTTRISMDASQRPRATRASKRRRITPTPPLQPSPKPARSVSPDELASHPHTPVILSRQHSTPSLAPQPPPDNQDEPRRPSFSPVSDSSPDELDHTIEAHSFYRADAPYPSHPFPDGTAPSSKAFHNLTIEPSLGLDSPPTPEYSRISTPIGSPPAGSDDAAAVAGAAAAAAAAAQPPPPSLLEPARFANYRCRQVLKGHKRGVAAVRFSKDGGLVASCCEYWASISILKKMEQFFFFLFFYIPF